MKQKSRFLKFAVCLVCVLLSALLLTGCTVNSFFQFVRNTLAGSTLPQQADFKVTMLDVGQGLSILVENDGHALLYDGGGRSASSFVIAYLRQHGNTQLDYVIASHYDEDHIAGLVGVLSALKVDTAIVPCYETDTKIYGSLKKALQNADAVLYARAGDSYDLGGIPVDILYACEGKADSENDESTVIRVSCGDFSVMITGDAQADTEQALVRSGARLKSTLYVVGHHGSSTSTSEKFVRAMRPKLAFISVGKDNRYGHPSEKTLETLAASGAQVYRTDTAGTVVLQYDGTAYTVTVQRDETQDEVSQTQSQPVEYILNTRTKKIHLPGCSAAEKIAQHNKAGTTLSKEELLRQGYDCCKLCDP